jgi:putative SOS response-associated peptidase YedK
MCGRYALYANTERIAEFTGLVSRLNGDFRPRYNVAPGTPIVAIQERLGAGLRSLETYIWGIKLYSDTNSSRIRPINARAETIDKKFTHHLRHHRCLIPCNGFFEPDKSSPTPHRQYYFSRGDNGLLAMAGIYNAIPTDHGLDVSCAIITVPANGTVSAINHDRMPALLPRKVFAAWLDPNYTDTAIRKLLKSCPDDLLGVHEVDAGLLNKRCGKELIDNQKIIEPMN